jgi:hypothetical protein
MTYYLYLIHEAPIQAPFYCKIGYSARPLKRLDELQAGNPRKLRSFDYERRPTEEFGFELPSENHAKKVERLVFQELEKQGVRLMRDLNYKTMHSSKREWVEMEPMEVWKIMALIYGQYLIDNGIQL